MPGNIELIWYLPETQSLHGLSLLTNSLPAVERIEEEEEEKGEKKK